MSKLSNKLAAGVRKVKAEQNAAAVGAAAAKADPAPREARPAEKRSHDATELHPTRIWPD